MPPEGESKFKSPVSDYTGEELRMKLRGYDRSPFTDMLATFIECAPTEDDIKRLAARAPDKYAQAVSTLARVAGFTEKTEITNNVNVNVSRMSDSQLEDKLKELTREMTVDADFVAIPMGSPMGAPQGLLGEERETEHVSEAIPEADENH